MSQPQMPPMPVIPVNPAYAVAQAGNIRPGVVTLVGVLSIVFAVFQMISNLGMGLYSIGSLVAAQEHKTQVKLSDLTLHPFIPPLTTEETNGFDETRVAAIIEGLNRHRALTPVRRDHLSQLMSKHGKKIFQRGAEGLNAARVHGNVTESGQFLTGSGKSAIYYIVAEGRIEVSDSQAIFRPDGGTTLRSTDTVTDRSLTEAEIDQVVASIDAGVEGGLNAAQRASVRKMLRDRTQPLFPTSPQRDTDVRRSGELQAAGAWFLTPNAQVRLSADGTPTLLATSAPEPGINAVTGQPISTLWARLLMIESLGSGLLSFLLLAAGIILLRGRPMGIRLHRIWAWIKLPLAIAGAVLFALSIREWQFAAAGNPNASSLGMASLLSGIGTALLGIAWPIIVLIVMRSRSVRNYFANVI